MVKRKSLDEFTFKWGGGFYKEIVGDQSRGCLLHRSNITLLFASQRAQTNTLFLKTIF